MSNLLQENLLYLYENRNDLLNQIQQYIDQSEGKKYYKLIESEVQPNLSYILNDREILLYEDTNVDISDWLIEHPYIASEKYDIVLYGLGLSYHLAKLIELNSDLNFYIIEPEIDIFLEALKVLNISQLLEHPQIKLLRLGNNDVDFNNFVYLKNLYLTNNTINLYTPFYLNLNEDIKRYFEKEYNGVVSEIVMTGFENFFGKLPYKNSIKNIYNLLNSCSLNELKNMYDGCTALVVGAGPSLEDDIKEIIKARENLLIIAAGSSVQSLIHFGLKPHLIVSIDPGEINGKVFELVDVLNIPLVFVNQIYPGILDKRNGLNFHAYFTNDPITEYFFKEMSISPKLLSNLSVSGTAIQIAAYLGAKTVMFTGQDLSFPNMQYYSAGANHFSSEELQSEMNQHDLTIENVMGGYNKTNYSMKTTLEDIEDLIAKYDGIKFINTSSRGAVIKNTEFMSFTEAVESISMMSYDFEQIKGISEGAISEFEISDINKKINLIIETCDFLIKNCNNSNNIINKIDQQCRKNPTRAMNLLAKLEKEFSKVTGNDLFKQIIPFWIRGVTRTYDQQVLRIQQEKNIVNKSKLLNEIVTPYIRATVDALKELQNEFIQLKKRLKEDNLEIFS